MFVYEYIGIYRFRSNFYLSSQKSISLIISGIYRPIVIYWHFWDTLSLTNISIRMKMYENESITDHFKRRTVSLARHS